MEPPLASSTGMRLSRMKRGEMPKRCQRNMVEKSVTAETRVSTLAQICRPGAMVIRWNSSIVLSMINRNRAA